MFNSFSSASLVGYSVSNRQSQLVPHEDPILADLDEIVSSMLPHDPYAHINRFWTGVMTGVILANCIHLCAETQWRETDYSHLTPIYYFLDVTFAVVFTLEVVFNCCIQRWAYFENRWNILDLVLTLSNVTDMILQEVAWYEHSHSKRLRRAIMFARSFRILRSIRILRLRPDALVPLQAVVSSASSIIWILISLAIILLFFSALFVSQIDHSIFGDSDMDSSDTACGGDHYFCDLTSAVVTLMSVIVGENWDTILGPLMIHQPWLIVPFIAFAVLTSYGVLNIMTAVVVDAVTNTREQMLHGVKADTLKDAAKLWKSRVDIHDRMEDRIIAIEDLIQHVIHRKWINFPIGIRPATVISLLKRDDSSAELTYEDFIVSISRLLLSDPGAFTVQTLTEQAKMTSFLTKIYKDIGKLKERVDRLDRVESKLDLLLEERKSHS